jgi:predicted metal-binding membrane protein
VGGVSASVSASVSSGRHGSDGITGSFAAVRSRLGLVALLVGLAGLGWWWTARQMAGMDAGPVWVVMRAAMMFPSVSPTVALYARMTRRRGLGRPLLFTAAYLIVWAAAGVGAYGAFALGRNLFGSALAWDNGGRWLAGGVLAAAAFYELTPFKDVCLSKCRSPLGFLLGSWRDGWSGALGMGGRHAAWCVGCCWALMAAFFALGVMSLVGMALVAALITIEKTLPWRRTVTWTTTVVLLVLAVALLVAPHSVPGLVVPGGMSDATMH